MHKHFQKLVGRVITKIAIDYPHRLYLSIWTKDGARFNFKSAASIQCFPDDKGLSSRSVYTITSYQTFGIVDGVAVGGFRTPDVAF